MRWYILRTLLLKEILRHLAERGAIFLAALLIVASLLLSFFGTSSGQSVMTVAGVRLCFLDYWEGDAWIHHLQEHRPPDVRILFRKAAYPVEIAPNVLYPPNSAAIQVRPDGKNAEGTPRYRVVFLYPGGSEAGLGPLAGWFWKQSLDYFHNAPVAIETSEGQFVLPDGGGFVRGGPAPGGEDRSRYRLLYHPSPSATGAGEAVGGVDLSERRAPLPGSADLRSMVATGLVFFALCFFSVYLLPALMCEERERGVLLAQALSPASPVEILASKFLFYPTLSLGLAALLAGVYQPAVLARPFFWLVLLTSSVGYLGVGLTIASVARTQREASMGALCYMLTVALLLFLTQNFGIPSVQYVALEYYGPRMAQAVLAGTVGPWHWLSLITNSVLAVGWMALATVVFRRQGWQ
jgi:hypothetical protein